jgi:hypothetical protein
MAGRRTRRFPIRDTKGQVVAYHCREDGPGGKRMWWELPDGTLGLGGLRTEELPLYGAHAAHRWDLDQPVIVVEGEKVAHAVALAGWQVVGTVTGAAGWPSRESLMPLLGTTALLWPDADEAGRQHMLRVAAILGDEGEGITAYTRWIDWAGAPPGGDAADALAAGVDVAALVAAAGPVIGDPPDDPPPRRGTPAVRPARRDVGAESPIERFNAAVTVSDVLGRLYGLQARPGRTVRCPVHDDRHASLSVMRDDRRVYCFSPGCPLNNDGRGRDAYDLASLGAAPA